MAQLYGNAGGISYTKEQKNGGHYKRSVYMHDITQTRNKQTAFAVIMSSIKIQHDIANDQDAPTSFNISEALGDTCCVW